MITKNNSHQIEKKHIQNKLMNFIELENITSMEKLLKTKTTVEIKENTILSGKITEIQKNGILVDIGGKAEGFITKNEFEDNWNTLQINDIIEVYLESIENEHSKPIISMQKANFTKKWNHIIATYKEGSVIKGTTKYKVRGGIIVDINGIEAFLPGSQIDLYLTKNIDEYLNQEYDFQIIKINTDLKNIIISRKELLEIDRTKKRIVSLKQLQKNETHPGIVKNITDFGVFIDINGLDGLLHITDISWGRINHPSELFHAGQKIDVIILDIDYTKERLSLGYKQKIKNPWETIEEKHPIGSKVKGKVKNITNYGAFVELECGIDGMIHISDMSWVKKFNKKIDEILNVGDEIKVTILNIQANMKKISLSYGDVKIKNPWETIEEKHPIGSKVKGKVKNITNYGAFVELECGIDGMIHISDMSWVKKINDPNNIVKINDTVESIILNIDKDKERIALGLKQLSPDPWETIDTMYSINQIIESKITKIATFGIFIKLTHQIDGLIHISQISNDSSITENNLLHTDKFNINDIIKVKIIKIDKQNRKISLSITALNENINITDNKTDENDKEILKNTDNEVSNVNKNNDEIKMFNDEIISQLKNSN